MDYEYYTTHHEVMSKDFTALAKEFGKNVRNIRQEQNITQEALANEAQIERSYMGVIERGEKNPTLKKLFQISRALHISLKKLFK